MARREADNVRREIEENLNAIEGMKALFKAASQGDAAEIRHILKTSPLVDVNSKSINLNTALHMAALNNRVEAIEALVEGGAYIDAVDKSNATPLYCAVSRQGKEAAAKLVELGADMTIRAGNGMAPLHASVVLDVPVITRMLLENGADIDQPTQNGNKVEELAGMYDHVQQINILMEYRAAINERRTKAIYAERTRAHPRHKHPRPRP